MLAYIEGKLVESMPLVATIDVQGLGYEIHMPLTTTEKLPPIGNKVKLQTVVIYREDSQTVYGFMEKQEKAFFKLLIEKVGGIGPKTALGIMSRLSLPVLQSAIATGDINLLSKCPGIGKKTAERLVVELKDKLSPGGVKAGGSVVNSEKSGSNSGTGESTADEESNVFHDAVAAMVTLGFKPADADKAVRKAFQGLKGDAATSETLIKKALGQ